MGHEFYSIEQVLVMGGVHVFKLRIFYHKRVIVRAVVIVSHQGNKLSHLAPIGDIPNHAMKSGCLLIIFHHLQLLAIDALQ